MSKGLKRKLRMRSLKGIKKEINDNNKEIEKYNSWLEKEYVELKESFTKEANEAQAQGDFAGFNAAQAMLIQIEALKRKTELDLRFVMADNEMLTGMIDESIEEAKGKKALEEEKKASKGDNK